MSKAWLALARSPMACQVGSTSTPAAGTMKARTRGALDALRSGWPFSCSTALKVM
jgi:hypothetical protein